MPSPTDAPDSLPAQIAAAEGELPTRLRIIADGDLRTMARDSLVGIHPDQHELHEWADLMDEAADALTAAESARDAAVAERDEARAMYEAWKDDWREAYRQVQEAWRGEIADCTAALARAERAEKALEPFTAPRAIGLMLRPVGTGASPAEPVLVEHVEWFDAARAALAHPAPAEELKP